MNKKSLVEHILSISLLSPSEAETVASHTETRFLKKGDFLLRPPEICNKITYIASGILRYYTIDEEGEEITSLFVSAGDFFTDLESYHQGKPTEAFVQSITDSEVCVLSKKVHEKLKKKVDGWYDTITTISERMLLEQLKLARQLMPLDAQGAYETFRAQYPTIVELAPDNQIASFLGMSKYTLSRIKAKLSK